MADFTAQTLLKLRENRLPGLDLGAGSSRTPLIYPAYRGCSILNLPDSICGWLGAPALGWGSLAPEIFDTLADPGIRRVILVVMDALAFHRLGGWMEDGTAPAWKALMERGWLFPLTSITPSTTSSALTSLWTGRSPAEHGIVGYELWLKEYGVVVNSILQAPMSFQGEIGTLEKAGFNPENYLPFPTLGAHLVRHGVRSFAFQHASILRSGLSRMFFKDVAGQRFHVAADLWANVRNLLENSARSLERQYIYVYWGEVDTLSHLYGPDDERTATEFASFSQAFERLFLDRLRPLMSSDTLLLLTADHGAIPTRPDPTFDLRNHPDLLRRLHLLPTGEHRLAYLHVRPGQVEAVREYIERAWPGQFAILDSADAIEKGLFGPGVPHPGLPDRLGDLIVVALGQAYLWWSNKDNLMRGRHGGLSEQEMLVPLLAARL
jgi:hypothetical protein